VGAAANILIGTPAYGGQLTTTYLHSLFKTVSHFRDEHPGITFSIDTPAVTLLAFARNVLASKVLNDPSFTHLLFIDADMGWEPTLIERMIAFDKPITSALCPRRFIDDELVYELRRVVSDAKLARMTALNYVGEEATDLGTLRSGFAQTRRAGTGIMLIQRTVLETFARTFPDLVVSKPGPYESYGVTGRVLQAFDGGVKDADGFNVGEDICFTYRWIKVCGGEIWTCIDETIAHVGAEVYTGNYALKQQVRADMAARAAEAIEPVSANRHGSRRERRAAEAQKRR